MLYYKDTTLYSTASYPTCFWQSLSVLMAHRRITSNVMRLTSGTMSKDSPEAALFVQTSSCQGWELCICISIHVRNQLAGINLSNIFYAQDTMQVLQVFEEAGIAGQCGVDFCGNAHNSSPLMVIKDSVAWHILEQCQSCPINWLVWTQNDTHTNIETKFKLHTSLQQE